MTSLSRIDFLRAQLHSQLQARTSVVSRAAPSAPATTTLAQLRALKAHGTRDPKVLVAALVQDVLLASLGSDLCNDAQFQAAAQSIAQEISEDPELLGLCLQCVDQA